MTKRTGYGHLPVPVSSLSYDLPGHPGKTGHTAMFRQTHVVGDFHLKLDKPAD